MPFDGAVAGAGGAAPRRATPTGGPDAANVSAAAAAATDRRWLAPWTPTRTAPPISRGLRSSGCAAALLDERGHPHARRQRQDVLLPCVFGSALRGDGNSADAVYCRAAAPTRSPPVSSLKMHKRLMHTSPRAIADTVAHTQGSELTDDGFTCGDGQKKGRKKKARGGGALIAIVRCFPFHFRATAVLPQPPSEVGAGSPSNRRRQHGVARTAVLCRHVRANALRAAEIVRDEPAPEARGAAAATPLARPCR